MNRVWGRIVNMFGVDLDKLQPDVVPTPADQPTDVIVSPDTHRENRIPPGQSRTRKWPVLDASGPPRIDLDSWRLRMWGGVNREVDLSWAEFPQLPAGKVFAALTFVPHPCRSGQGL